MKTATLGQVRKVLELLDKVPQEQVQAFLESGLLSDLFSADIAGMDRQEFREVCGLFAFKIWKTIKLGTTGLKTADDFRKAHEEGGFRISDWADDILGKPAFRAASEETEIDLVVVSGRDLGFEQSVPREQIYARAKEFGLEPCPVEVGPQLRLQYADQPLNEWLLIGMEPIADSGGSLRVFCVVHGDGGRWLGSNGDDPDSVWDPVILWVFCLSRK